ncbi:hypothetical protein BGZ54_006644 [Gamsiella multidivaricata]|nr:hypothetical protein BGZ54_006644 [Gamsiella multidivaricata]
MVNWSNIPFGVLILIVGGPVKSVVINTTLNEPISVIFGRISLALREDLTEIYVRTLFINGIPIHDENKPLSFHRVFGNVITYRAIKPRTCPLLVKTLDGNILPFNCNPNVSTAYVKSLIRGETGIPQELFKLYSLEKELQDSDNIQNGALAMFPQVLVNGPCGTSDARPVGTFEPVDMQMKLLTNTAPPGRNVGRGTNVECWCNCTSEYPVICPQFLGQTEVSQRKFRCPVCNQEDGRPITAGFVDCKYRVHGIKDTGEQYTSDWKIVRPEDCYELFDSGDQIKWQRLIIESARVDDLDKCLICLEPMAETLAYGCTHRLHMRCSGSQQGKCPLCEHNTTLVKGCIVP